MQKSQREQKVAEEKLATANQQVQQAEQKITDASQKQKAAEEKLATANQQVQQAEQKIADASQKQKIAEEKLATANQQVQQAEQKVADANTELAQRDQQAKHQIQLATQKLQYAKFQVEQARQEQRKAKVQLQEVQSSIEQSVRNALLESAKFDDLSSFLLRTGKQTEAEKMLSAYVNLWESLQLGLTNDLRVQVSEKLLSSYRSLQNILVLRKQVSTALEISERLRARAFSGQLVSKFSNQLSTRFLLEPPNIQQIKQIANAHQATLVEYSIIYSDQEATGQKQPQGSELYIWVVKPTGEVAFREVNLKASKISLENLVPSSRASIGVRGSSDIKRGGIRIEIIIQDNRSSQQKSLKQLYELLIKPVEEFLPTDPNARVIFIPQGPLFSVTFAALMNTNGKYLIEEHTISTTPSIQILSLIRQQRQHIRGIGQNDLVVGNPQMPSIRVRPGEPPVRLSNLPGAEKEAVEIAKLLKTEPFLGSRATKNFIVQQMPQAKRIHLATHGLVDDSSGQLGIPGIIALAPSGKDDGLLTANEILRMKLNAELVILSACDTAQGKITSDGVDGLSRSFMIAGVPSLIVSQWSIPDYPTAELMIEFYRNLQNGKLDKAQSLRQAMLTVMRQHPNPRDWAGFILIGEAD